MPELPEVETIRQDLRQKILHKPITMVEVRRAKIVKGRAAPFIKILTGNSIVEIDRIGKLILLRLQSGGYVAIHLKMTGQLLYRFHNMVIAGGHTFPPVEAELPSKHTHVIISFADGSTLFFNDMRLFGYMAHLTDSEREAVYKKYGPEPFEGGLTTDHLSVVLKNRKVALKAVLLNQEFVAGIGNIYADEICFLAKVRPSRRASSITKKEAEALVAAAKKVIAQAIKERGTTFNDYRDPEGRKGNFVKFLKVYGRAGEPCVVCGTSLARAVVVGRGTVFCKMCQK